MQSILKIENLSIRFGDKNVIENSSFELLRGQTIGIVGESGSGKSLTALAILGLIPYPGIVKGKIEIEGIEINQRNYSQFRGRKIGMIFQEPMTSLNPVLTCGEQIKETIQQHLKLSDKEAYDKTINLFEKVKLPNAEVVYEKYPHQISGGQKQRVMIAMAISCDPILLIADEPTTALDVTVQKTILELLKEIQIKNQMGMIFISHDLAIIASISEKIMVMNHGKVVEQGNKEQIFKNPQQAYTKALIACRPPLNKRLKILPTVSDFIQNETKEFIPEIIKIEERIKQHEIIYSKKPILEINNLSVFFPSKNNFFGKVNSLFKAVDDVSFKVYQGETLGIIGESGCGKTTIGKTLVKLLEPKSGEIIFNGKNIQNFNKTELSQYRKKVQIIFQDPYSSLNPRITIGDAICEVMQVHKVGENQKERIEKTKSLLIKVGLLPEHFNRYPHEFSGGQRQRISIARTLAVEPEIIICDESVSALDISVQAQVLNLLNHLKQDFNLTYLFISHDLSVVKFLCDRMLVMKEGKIVEQGESDDLYKNSKNSYTQMLIQSLPEFI